jgi:hypothetical protein
VHSNDQGRRTAEVRGNGPVTDRIEQPLTMLFRRANRVHLLTQDGDVTLER